MTPEEQEEREGLEPGTSNNIYYLTIYRSVTLERVAVERQNMLCKGGWKDWPQKYPDWRSLLVYSSRQLAHDTSLAPALKRRGWFGCMTCW